MSFIIESQTLNDRWYFIEDFLAYEKEKSIGYIFSAKKSGEIFFSRETGTNNKLGALRSSVARESPEIPSMTPFNC